LSSSERITLYAVAVTASGRNFIGFGVPEHHCSAAISTSISG
jgi:hypothetical protein